MPGRDVAALWRGRTIRAWLPDRLAQRVVEPTDPPTIRASERARQQIIAADERTPTEWEPLARLLLRAEGVASSYIEGVRASVPDVALAELDPSGAGAAAGWVAANLHTIDRALRHAHGGGPLTSRVLHGWHRLLMADHTALSAAQVGAWRTEQGWIGGTSPLDAALITPPPAELPDLMADLIDFLGRTDLDPVVQAAVAHAQFEVVHPYADGNGRLGRVLILWVLARRTGVRVLPPVSLRLSRDTGGYLSGLTQYRVASADPWIRWFADTIASAAGSVTTTMTALAELTSGWRVRLGAGAVRSDATSRRVLSLLPARPVVSAAVVAEQLAVSERSARTALAQLAEYGILAALDAGPGRGSGGPGRPSRWWYAPEIVDLVRP